MVNRSLNMSVLPEDLGLAKSPYNVARTSSGNKCRNKLLSEFSFRKHKFANSPPPPTKKNTHTHETLQKAQHCQKGVLHICSLERIRALCFYKVLLVWTIHICMEIHDTYKMALAYTTIPRARHTRWQTSEDGALTFISLSWHRYLTLLCCVIAPRGFVACVLLSVGSRFIIETSSLADLILNALALSFVLELDELFFKLVPSKCKELIRQSAPLSSVLLHDVRDNLCKQLLQDTIFVLNAQALAEQHLQGRTRRRQATAFSIFSNGSFPSSPGFLCNLARKSPQNLEKFSQISGRRKTRKVLSHVTCLVVISHCLLTI